MNKIIGLLLITLLSACNLYNDVVVKEVRDVSLSEFGTDGLTAEVQVVVDNPNSFKVKITDSDLDVAINGTEVGKVKLGDMVVLDKKTTALYTLKFSADYDDMSPKFIQSLITLLFVNHAEFSATGYVKGRALFVAKKVKVDVKERVDLRE